MNRASLLSTTYARSRRSLLAREQSATYASSHRSLLARAQSTDARVGPFLSTPAVSSPSARHPVAVLFGWAGAADAHVRKHAHACVAAGCSGGSLRMTAPWLPPLLSARANAPLVSAALDALCQPPYDRAPLFLWYASNGGAFVHEELLTLLREEGAERRWPGLRSRVAGTAFDSAPAALNIAAFRSAAVGIMPAEGIAGSLLRPLVAALAPAVGVFLTTSSRPREFWQAMQADGLRCPSLYIYSLEDGVTDAEALDGLVAHRRARHARGPAAIAALRLEATPHVGHLRAEPLRYTQALAELIRVGVAECAAEPSQ